MTRDYLIRMAHECGIHLGGPPLEPGLERFADLVAEAEREACASKWEAMHGYDKYGAAAAIRSRGQK